MVGVALSKSQPWSNSEPSDLPRAAAQRLNSADLTNLTNQAEMKRNGDHAYSAATQQVPIIDMAVLEADGGGLGADEREKMSQEMARACETWGFFQLVNHGIDGSLLQRAREVSREFFKGPDEEKLEYKVTPGSVEGFYSRKLTTVGTNKLSHSVDHLFYYTSPPSRKSLDRWPRTPPAYRETMAEYAEQVRILAEKLMCILSERLGLERAVLQERLAGSPTGEPTQSIRTNYYTPTGPKDHPNGSETPSADDVLQLDAHSDPGGLTLLVQNDIAGLQVKKDGQWVGVEPIPNTFVVNIGDQIEILSNGRYKSIEHRGLAHRSQERLSLATFYSPDSQAVIGPVEELVSHAYPALYKSIKYGDYFGTFVVTGLNGKEHVKAATV